jgi:hypothetical protein
VERPWLGKAVLYDNVPDAVVPKEIFGDENVVNMSKFFDWVGNRAFPENRVDKDKLIKELGLSCYSSLGVSMELNCSLMTDQYWVRIEDSDNYYEKCATGRAGIEPISW